LPGCAAASVSSINLQVPNTISKRPETLPAWLGPTRWQAGATAYTGGRWQQCYKTQ